MSDYIVHDVDGKILRTGSCPIGMVNMQAQSDEFVVEGKADDITQKIVDGKIVDKTPAEIEADNPPRPVVPPEKQAARITNEQWQDVLARLETLESGEPSRIQAGA